MTIKHIGPSLTGAVQNPGITSVKPNGEDKTGNTGTIPSDRVEISQNYRDLTQATKALVSTADVRTEKVDQIRNQVASGSYQVNPSGIADRMIDEII
jgi:flagellar biosynthesis anti-sigma factor FlgM